jgi:hypothetical protein
MVRLPGSLDTKQCICAFALYLKSRLGEEISTSRPLVSKSVLYEVPPSGGEPIVDLTTQNCFIKGWWADFKPNFRFAVMHLMEKSSFQWHFSIITDEQIKTVFVGSEAYTQRSKKKRDDIVTYNSLSDLLGESQDLVVIRLGFLGYKNVAMAGALKESLMIRQALGKPTWILEEPNSVFDEGHHSWSLDVEEYIQTRYEVVELPQLADHEYVSKRGRIEVPSIASDEGLAVDEGEVVPKPPPKREAPKREAPTPKREVPASTSDLMNDPSIVGSKEYRDKKKYSQKRRF